MEKKALVPDASVIVKWFTQEEKRKEAIELRNGYVEGEVEIVIPDLLLYEILNALRYNPNFNDEDVKKAVNSLLNMELNIITPTQEVLEKTIEIAFSKNITIYDAAYIALAETIGFEFITADEKLYEKIKELKFVYLL